MSSIIYRMMNSPNGNSTCYDLESLIEGTINDGFFVSDIEDNNEDLM